MEVALFCNLIMGMISHCLCWIHYLQKQVTTPSLHSRAGDYTRPWIPLVGSTGGHVRSASCKGSRAHAWTWAPLAVVPTGSLHHFVHGSIVFSSQGLCLFTCKSRVSNRDSKTSFFPVPILNGWPWISGASNWEGFHWCAGASFHISNRLCIHDVTLKSAMVGICPPCHRQMLQTGLSYPHLRAGC